MGNKKSVPRSVENEDWERKETGLDVKGHYVVEVIKLRNVPDSGVMNKPCDPYVKLRLRDEDNKTRGLETQTIYKRECANPVFHSYCDIRPDNREELNEKWLLEVEVWDKDVLSDELVCFSKIPIESVIEKPKFFALKNVSDSKKNDDKLNSGERHCTIMLRRIFTPVSRKKTMFFIRHAESKFNKAQNEKDLLKLLGFDHGLTEDGMHQSMKFNRKWKEVAEQIQSMSALEDKFMKADTIFASPLSRSTETAVLSLADHPTAKEMGITLLSSAREMKTRGGFDTVSESVGVEIVEKCKKEIAEVFGNDFMEKVFPMIDTYDAISAWWTGANSHDSEKDMEERFEHFLRTIRYYACDVPIVVSHSMFFRHLSKVLISKEFSEKNPELSNSMINQKLENAGCVALEIDFYHTKMPRIVNATPMFGSVFK